MTLKICRLELKLCFFDHWSYGLEQAVLEVQTYARYDNEAVRQVRVRRPMRICCQ